MLAVDSNFLDRYYKEQELNKHDVNIIQESYWSGIRGSLFKKIVKGSGGSNQWFYIIGKKTRYPDGSRIRLSEKSIRYLQQVVDYLNSTEGLQE